MAVKEHKELKDSRSSGAADSRFSPQDDPAATLLSVGGNGQADGSAAPAAPAAPVQSAKSGRRATSSSDSGAPVAAGSGAVRAIGPGDERPELPYALRQTAIDTLACFNLSHPAASRDRASPAGVSAAAASAAGSAMGAAACAGGEGPDIIRAACSGQPVPAGLTWALAFLAAKNNIYHCLNTAMHLSGVDRMARGHIESWSDDLHRRMVHGALNYVFALALRPEAVAHSKPFSQPPDHSCTPDMDSESDCSYETASDYVAGNGDGTVHEHGHGQKYQPGAEDSCEMSKSSTQGQYEADPANKPDGLGGAGCAGARADSCARAGAGRTWVQLPWLEPGLMQLPCPDGQPELEELRSFILSPVFSHAFMEMFPHLSTSERNDRLVLTRAMVPVDVREAAREDCHSDLEDVYYTEGLYIAINSGWPGLPVYFERPPVNVLQLLSVRDNTSQRDVDYSRFSASLEDTGLDGRNAIGVIHDDGKGIAATLRRMFMEERTFICSLKLASGSLSEHIIERAEREGIRYMCNRQDLFNQKYHYVSYQEHMGNVDRAFYNDRTLLLRDGRISYHVFFDPVVRMNRYLRLTDFFQDCSNLIKSGKSLSHEDKELLKTLTSYNEAPYFKGQGPAFTVNQDAVKDYLRYQGYMVLVTNDNKASANKVLHRYLLAVEVSRAMSMSQGDDLKIMLSFMAQGLRNELVMSGYRARTSRLPVENSCQSMDALRRTLDTITMTYDDQGRARFNVPDEASDLLLALGIPAPPEQ